MKGNMIKHIYVYIFFRLTPFSSRTISYTFSLPMSFKFLVFIICFRTETHLFLVCRCVCGCVCGISPLNSINFVIAAQFWCPEHQRRSLAVF